MAQITTVGRQERQFTESPRIVMLALLITVTVLLGGVIGFTAFRSMEASSVSAAGSGYGESLVAARQAEIAAGAGIVSGSNDALVNARLAELGRSNFWFDDALANARRAEHGR